MPRSCFHVLALALFAVVAQAASAGSIWIGGDHGIVRYSSDGTLQGVLDLTGSPDSIEDVAVAKNGTVYAIVDTGVFLEDGVARPVPSGCGASGVAATPTGGAVVACDGLDEFYDYDPTTMTSTFRTAFPIAGDLGSAARPAVTASGDLFYAIERAVAPFDDVTFRNATQIALDTDALAPGAGGTLLTQGSGGASIDTLDPQTLAVLASAVLPSFGSAFGVDDVAADEEGRIWVLVQTPTGSRLIRQEPTDPTGFVELFPGLASLRTISGVPEPATVLLAAVALAGLGLRSRRLRQPGLTS